MSTETEGKLGIATAIADLRAEIEKAMADGQGKALRFLAEEVTLELSVGFTTGKDGKVGFKVWVAEAGGGMKRDDTGSHKVTLKLKIEGSNRIANEGGTRLPTPDDPPQPKTER